MAPTHRHALASNLFPPVPYRPCAAPLGVVAKRIDLPYQAGIATECKRSNGIEAPIASLVDSVMANELTREDELVGSLPLGLYDDQGLLHHVGFTSGLKASEKGALTDKLEAVARHVIF